MEWKVLHLWPLWLLVGVAFIVLAAKSRADGLRREQIVVATWLRAIAFILLTLALTQPILTVGTRAIAVVYVLDVSRSISSAFIDTALKWIGTANLAGRPAGAHYVVFGAHAQVVDSLDEVPAMAVTLDEVAATNGVIYQGATNLEKALDVARSIPAPGHMKRLVLFSDGNQTQGDVWRALARLRAEKVRVFSIPAPVSVTTDAWVDALEVRPDVRAREPLALRVRAFSRMEAAARLELRVADEPLPSRAVRLSPGMNEWIVDARFKRPGMHVVEARLVAAGDQVPENDILKRLVRVQPRTRVLYLERSQEDARYLSAALRREGIDVTVADPGRMTSVSGLLDVHDAVILSDLPPASIGLALARRLEQFVREGGGLIFAAGDSTYGRDGFAGSPIETVLPVRFEEPRERGELDLVLLIDRSSSMQGLKLEFAKTAALSTMEMLAPHHRLAVIAFDAKPHDVVPLGRTGDKDRSATSIGRMSASGQTNIFTALWHVRNLLRGSRAKIKHVILLSDGDTVPVARARTDPLGVETKVSSAGPTEPMPQDFVEMTALLAQEQITLSTVAIGDAPQLEFMSNLARWTHGLSQVASSESDIPVMMVNEVRRVLGDSIIEKPFRPVVKTQTAALRGIDFARGPALRGFVIGRAKPFAEVLLEATDRQPLLAQMHYGLGRTVAFLSDVKNRWAVDWLTWDGYGKLWAQVVRGAVRGRANTLTADVVRKEDAAIVTLSAMTPDGSYRNGLRPRLQVTTPQGGTYTTELAQVGPGEYAARVSVSASDLAPYRFEFLQTPGIADQERIELGLLSLFYPHPDEYRVLPPDIELLQALSANTGGKFAPQSEELFADYGDRGRRSITLWPYFAFGGLAFFLSDILARRCAWSRKPLAVRGG